MESPLVSIIIPVYNGSEYVKEAIDSAINQTYFNKEIIVVNDGSTDGGATESIVKSYGDKVRYFYKENGGVSSALNLGIKEMKGEYFSWLSHDDKYTLDKLEKEVSALNEQEDKNILIYCAARQIDKNSDFLPRVEILSTEKTFYTWKQSLSILLKKGTINGCGLLIPKTVFEKTGGFDESLRYNQDSMMWYKIFLGGTGMLFIPDICVFSRVHDKQLTQTGISLFHGDCLKMSEYLIPKFAEISDKKNKFYLYYLLYNAKYNNREVITEGKEYAKGKKLLSICSKLKIDLMMFYGGIRPTIRRLYYRLLRRMKTN